MQPGHQEPLIGQIIGGRYEVVRLIGKGGMGRIFEVRNTRLGQPFALKTLDYDTTTNPGVLKRFRREADVIARIKHPNIVEIIDWETLSDGSPAMVMEYLRGEDLASRLAKGPVDWPFLARVVDQMLAALSVAHANGIVHRDLKPQNVFLARDDEGNERVKLFDFGVSKVRDSKSMLTSDDHLVGTPAYMSPEQADGRSADVGPYSDVWAIGVILHEMASGSLPFEAQGVPSLLYKICHGEPVALGPLRPDAPAAFVELVTAAMTRDVGQRIADATELRTRLREALRDVPGVQFAEIAPTAPIVDIRIDDDRNDDSRPRPLDTNFDTSAEVATPSIIARRKLAPVALVVAGAAAIAIGAAIFVATRTKPSRAIESSAPIEKPVAVESRTDASIVVEAEATPDAVLEAAAVLHTVPAPAGSSAGSTKRRNTGVPPGGSGSAEPAKIEPTKVEPTKVEPAKVETKKPPCAKDDVDCLYGDGT